MRLGRRGVSKGAYALTVSTWRRSGGDVDEATTQA